MNVAAGAACGDEPHKVSEGKETVMSDEQSVAAEAENQTPVPDLTAEQFAAELEDLYVMSETYFAAMEFVRLTHYSVENMELVLWAVDVIPTVGDVVAHDIGVVL